MTESATGVTEPSASVTESCGNRERLNRGSTPVLSRLFCHESPVTIFLSRLSRRASGRRGFTLIELIVVLAIIALLLSLAVPRYFAHVQHAKEATLKQDLNIIRDAIDKFHGDRGRYPESLEELVTLRYIRSVPQDPVTESTTSWKIIPPTDSEAKGSVYDVKSGADGAGQDGKPFADW